jgi:hypothetical protein
MTVVDVLINLSYDLMNIGLDFALVDCRWPSVSMTIKFKPYHHGSIQASGRPLARVCSDSSKIQDPTPTISPKKG